MAANFKLKAKDHLNNADSKRYYNLHHFTESAPKYDIATRLLSLGRDKAWKKLLIQALPQFESPTCVDIACGTGDIAFELARKYPQGKILGTDLTQAMVDIAARKNHFANLRFAANDMCQLEVDSNSVDILTGSYAIRNAPRLEDVLREIHRVLKPGGWAALLDFSKPSSKFAQLIQYRLLKFWGSFCGLVLHGNPEVHGYISASIKNFPERKVLHSLFEEFGFRLAKKKRLYFGMLEIIVLQKC